MLMPGYIKLRRDLPDWLWANDAKLKWYIDLLRMAAVKDSETAVKGRVDMTMRQLAERWGTTTPTVSDFLKKLDKEDMVLLVRNGYVTLQGALQKSLQQPLQIFVREISELRNVALQRSLQEPLQQPLQGNGEKDDRHSTVKDGTQKETSEESDRYVKFRSWVEANAPWCYRNLKMINEVQFYTLLQKYTPRQVSDVILDIENYAKRVNYKDLYLTVKNWLEKRYGTL